MEKKKKPFTHYKGPRSIMIRPSAEENQDQFSIARLSFRPIPCN